MEFNIKVRLTLKTPFVDSLWSKVLKSGDIMIASRIYRPATVRYTYALKMNSNQLKIWLDEEGESHPDGIIYLYPEQYEILQNDYKDVVTHMPEWF